MIVQVKVVLSANIEGLIPCLTAATLGGDDGLGVGLAGTNGGTSVPNNTARLNNP